MQTTLPDRASPFALYSRVGAALAMVLCGGCHADHVQSMLHPASSASSEIAWLWWFLFTVCLIVLIAVMVLTYLAVFRRPEEREEKSPLGTRFIVVSGVLIPAVILLAILLASVKSQVALAIPETDVTIEVVGYQWWWEVRYPEEGIVTANELYIPVGEPVLLKLRSADVIHSLWIPNLNGKTDMLPDKVNLAWIAADRPGVFRGQCAEYCGVQHAWMALEVVALPREEFDEWVDARRQPVPEPDSETVQRGKEVFVEAACHNCHAVDGVFEGRRGPDLTHIATRRTIGAGMLPNNRGNLAGWISNPQAIKPGNLMPRTFLEPEDLHALVEYLETLE
jgi:cytochrome c oxidase subunit II